MQLMSVGDPCLSYQLQVAPRHSELEAVEAIQDAVEPGREHLLIRLPAASLHMTVLAFVDADDSALAARTNIWRENYRQIVAELEALINETITLPPIVFTRLAWLDTAVVLLGESTELMDMRRRIIDEIRVPGLIPRAPQIVHMSLFRFRTDPGLRPAEQSIEFVLDPNSLRLIEETRWPSLDLNLLARFRTGVINVGAKRWS